MSIQYSESSSGFAPINDLYTGLTVRNDITAAINTSLVSAGWTSEALNAFTVFSLTGPPTDTNTVTLAGKTYTFKTVINNGADGEVLIGVDAATTLANLGNAVNLGPGSGTAYSSATTANTFVTAGTSGIGVTAFEYNLPGVSSIIISQTIAGPPSGLTASEATSTGSLSSATINWQGYKCTSARTPAGLACKYAIYNANDANTGVRNIAMNVEETELSNSFAGGEGLFGAVSIDVRVMADAYQCFVMQNGAVGNVVGIFWCIGVPWIPTGLLPSVITGASNTSPIVITTSLAHGFTTGDLVITRGVLGNLAANVTTNAVTVLTPTTFELDGTTGDGSWTSGGWVGIIDKQIVECIWSQGTSSGFNFIRDEYQPSAYFTALNGSTQKNGSGIGTLSIGTVIRNRSNRSALAWFNGSYLVTEPLMIMGTSDVTPGVVVGQWWDAVMVRKPEAADVHTPPGSMDGKNWWNLNDNAGIDSGDFLSSFWIVIP